MRKSILFIVLSLCVLPSCLSRKQVDTPAQESRPDEKNTASDRKESKKSSLFKRTKEHWQERTTLSKKSYQELRNKQQEYIRNGDPYLALKYTEQMYNQCEDIEELCDLMLTLGDLCFTQKNYKKASTLFCEFVRAYPGSPQIEHASYYTILCSFEQQTTTADRDQTTTKETIALAEAFLKRTEFTTYKTQVQAILDNCQQRLLDHEMGIVHFYSKKGNLHAANKRLNGIRQEFIARLTNAEPQILLEECRLAYAQHNIELAEKKALELAAKFPHYLSPGHTQSLPELATLLQSASIVVAQKENTVSSFVDRF